MTIPINQTFTLTNTSNRTITDGGSGTNTITNNGVVQKTNTGIYTVGVGFINASGAEVTILTGTLKFTGNLDNQGTIMGTATIDLTATTVLDYGAWAPGTSAGTLEVKGDFESECLEMELGNQGSGVIKDLLEVTQIANLQGILNVEYLGGTVPPGSHEIINCGGASPCINGTFTTVNLPPNCVGCTIDYQDQAVFLVNNNPIQFSGSCAWNGGNGDWFDQNNWDCNDVPNADDTVSVAANQITINQPVSISVLNLSGGDLTGNGNLTVTNNFNWSGGALTMAGTHSVGPVDWNGNLFLANCNLTMAAGGLWNNPNLTLSNSSVLNLAAGQTLNMNISSPSNLGNSGGVFNNHGTLVKNGNAPFTINTPYDGLGFTNILQGVLAFTNSFNNTNGTVTGIGLIDLLAAAVQSYGIFAPGTSPGTLTVEGDYTNRRLDVEIEENAGMVENDLLIVSGNASLGDTLDIAHTGGTIPQDEYLLLQCNGGASCLSGTFTTVNFPAFCGGICSIVYTGNTASLMYGLPVPLELILFQGKRETEGIRLFWQTATETQNKKFEIERSSDGLSWETIGQTLGAGTSLDKRDYEYLDKTPLEGLNYYRLKSLSFSGIADYSKTIFVEAKEQTWRAFPNPVQEILTLEFLEKPISVVSLLDWTGKVVLSQNFKYETQGSFDMTDLPQGMYVLKMPDGTSQVIVKN